MSLIQDQRMKYLKFIRPLFIKSECEICGSDNELELHHEKQFAQLLHDTLKELNLEYNEAATYYSQYQRKMITDLMLGKQVRIKYTTVCRECHIVIHNLYGKDKAFKKTKVINVKLLEETLINNYSNVRMFSKEIDELETVFRNCGYKERTFGKFNANKFLKQLNIPIEIISKRCRINDVQIRYWCIK